MNDEMSLDETSVFAGKLRFLIPHDWEELEPEEDNVYLYSQRNADSGWFRVSLTSITCSEAPEEKLKRIFEKRDNVSRDDQTKNLVHAYQKTSEQDGVKTHLYFWVVANVVKPNLVREAIFSYTILRERIEDESTVRLSDLFGQIASRAIFGPNPS